MKACAVTRTVLPLTFTLEVLTPRVLATSKFLPDFDAFGSRGLSEIMSLPLLISTIIAFSFVHLLCSPILWRSLRFPPKTDFFADGDVVNPPDTASPFA
jgi:hypothetical protein